MVVYNKILKQRIIIACVVSHTLNILLVYMKINKLNFLILSIVLQNRLVTS